jgi:hypothetical protein
MYDLVVYLVVLVTHVVLGLWVLRFIANKVMGIVMDKKKDARVKQVKTLVIVAIGLSVMDLFIWMFREKLYAYDVTNNIVVQSMIFNVVFLIVIGINKLLEVKQFNKLKTVLGVLRTILYAYSVFGYGFYYIVSVFKLGFSGLLI